MTGTHTYTHTHSFKTRGWGWGGGGWVGGEGVVLLGVSSLGIHHKERHNILQSKGQCVWLSCITWHLWMRASLFCATQAHCWAEKWSESPWPLTWREGKQAGAYMWKPEKMKVRLTVSETETTTLSLTAAVWLRSCSSVVMANKYCWRMPWAWKTHESLLRMLLDAARKETQILTKA